MTLNVFLRFENGCILISDRQASYNSGQSLTDKKVFTSGNKDFAITGSGNGLDVVGVCTTLIEDNTVIGNNVVAKLRETLGGYCSMADRYSDVKANVHILLIAREDAGLIPYYGTIHRDRPLIQHLEIPYRCCGDNAARIIANYFLKKIKLDELNWMEATQYAIATLKEVGKDVYSVGSLEDFGLDIVVMLDNGAVYESDNFSRDSAIHLIKLEEIIEDISSDFIRTCEPEEGN